ncbi:response regulator transcription factor [Myroides sp. 1354]|uniref:LytR/AlgR family response regulator transcription factor n=1 Tax=unclassified Myroides TaxID=2642485 RepID=UPI002575C01F|nr:MULTISPECIES: LytTR family DNA-binding domain-containing protein [unclassified Myroides]MDM1043871.1 response regulator transcription factor [Myroides sp. R163-1]MDM1054806.1 response regulator transcription factor [Myroides sp. 1354]MDM1068103.1 response regulator transcription factor [Myroides sp. 1372]
MNIVIIEDEKPAARLLMRELEKLGFGVQHILHSVGEAIPWFLQNEQPDLIFADIQLTDGLSLEIFEQIELKHSAIIFVTSFDHYAIKAFKLNSIDYLLKPIDAIELLGAITKFKKQHNKIGQQVEMLKHSLQSPSFPKRMIVKLGMQLKVVLVDEVVCFYREDRGVYITTIHGKTHLLDEPSIEAVLKMVDPAKFFRVNRYQVVGIDYIEKIIQLSTSRLKLVLLNYCDEVIVSRERVGDFKLWLGAN